MLRHDADQPVADHRFIVDLGPATPRATSVTVGGRTLALTTPDAGARSTQVVLTDGAGGVAFMPRTAR